MRTATTELPTTTDDVHAWATALTDLAGLLGCAYDAARTAEAGLRLLGQPRPETAGPAAETDAGYCTRCHCWDVELVHAAGQHLCPGCCDTEARERDQLHWQQLDTRARRAA